MTPYEQDLEEVKRVARSWALSDQVNVYVFIDRYTGRVRCTDVTNMSGRYRGYFDRFGRWTQYSRSTQDV